MLSWPEMCINSASLLTFPISLCLFASVIFMSKGLWSKTPPEQGATNQYFSNHSSHIKYRRWGIFEVAYEASPRSYLSLVSCLQTVRELRTQAAFSARLLCDLHGMAPLLFSCYLLGNIWTSFATALNLYLSGAILQTIEESLMNKKIDSSSLRGLLLTWSLLAVTLSIVKYILPEIKEELRGHLKANLLPRLSKVSLNLDIQTLRDKRQSFPNPDAMEREAPGWECVEMLVRRLRTTSTIVLQFLALILIISHKKKFDMGVLILISVLQQVLMWASPRNIAGNSGYAFWTRNAAFHRLNALHHVIFSANYREDLLKGGITNCLQKEYERTSKTLGVVKDSCLAASNLPRPIEWDILNDVALDMPWALYALTLPWSLSASSLASMALLQQATGAVRLSTYEYMTDHISLTQICSYAQRLYETLEAEMTFGRGDAVYPDPHTSSEKGMKISFRNVSLRYSGQRREALSSISFEIHPGQLVVVVGTSGSGKTSMLNLLAQLFQPSSGTILIDDKPLSSFDINQFRRSTAFLSQCAQVYPLSLRENLQFGLDGGLDLNQEKVDHAAIMGGSYDMICSFEDGFDTVLNPIPTVGMSTVGLGLPQIPKGVLKELSRVTKKYIPITAGQKQRLAASRTFMRLENSRQDIKLLVVDEPCSSEDPLAEHDLFSKFRKMRDGKTVILVTHRFGSLAKRADMIICMREGKVVEFGTHSELMTNTESEYVRLYNVQASGYSTPVPAEKEELL